MNRKKTILIKAILIVVAAAAVLAAPYYITSVYYLHVVNLCGIYTLIAIGLNILGGYTGQTSMGQAGFFAIGTYVTALLMMNLDMSFFLAIVIGTIVTGLFGFIISIPAMKLNGPYLVLATVGFGEIVRLVLINWTPVTRGAAGLTGIPYPELFGLRIYREQQFFYLILAFVVLAVYVASRIAHSKIGRTMRAVRDDEIAAAAMGININRYKTAAFIIGAMLAGMAGGLMGAFSGVTSPDTFTFDESVSYLCMSVIGGNTTIIGGILGAFLLTFLSEGLRFLQDARLIIYGLILVLTVIYMPNGLVGLAVMLRQKFRARRAAARG